MIIEEMTASIEVPTMKYDLNEGGVVQRFIDRHEGDFIYVVESKKWMYWDGSRWRESLGQESEAALKMIRDMSIEATALLAMDQQDAYKKLSTLVSKVVGKVPYLLNLAAKQSAFRRSINSLDRTPNYLCCGTWTIDVEGGVELASDPTDLTTKMTGTDYRPGAPAPLWDAFLCQMIPDPEMRDYLQKLAGYTALGGYNERVVVFLHGTGRNGKSVFVETVREVLGDYAQGIPVSALLNKPTGGSATPELARLRGARMVVASEFEDTQKVNTALLKQASGDEKITARPMYGEPFDFTFTGVIWISTNDMPRLGTDQAVWDRIRPVHFPVRLEEKQVDVKIKEKLLRERSGILNWILEGARRYLIEGIEAPAQARADADELRHDQNELADFLDSECVVVREGLTAPATTLYVTYAQHCMDTGEKPLSKVAFGRALGRDAQFTAIKDTHGIRGRGWLGIAINAPFQGEAK